MEEKKNQSICSAEIYAQRAMNHFQEGFNCTQSVVLAFAEDINLPTADLLRMVSSFGGGMGRLREVCGAVSGMFLIAGFFYGYDDPADYHAKRAHYYRIQELAEQFREKHSAIVCRELLGLKQDGASHYAPERRTEQYYKKRPCKELVGDAARIMGHYLLENHQNQE